MKRLLLSIFFVLLSVSAYSFQALLYVDDVPAIADTAAHCLYVSVLDNGSESFAATFRTTDGASTFTFDGKSYAGNSLVQVAERNRPHTITFAHTQPQTWQVVFTLMPVVAVDYGDHSGISKEREVAGLLQIASPQHPTNGEAYFESDITIHYRGSTGLMFPKKNYAITLVDELDQEVDQNLMDIRADSKWILDAMAVDYSRMRNRLCTDVWNAFSSLHPDNPKMQRNGTQGYFVEVILNGRYHGLYCFTDKINRKLLGIKKVQSNGLADDNTRGVLYKCVAQDYSTCQMQMPADELLGKYSFEAEKWFDWELKYPNTPSEEAWSTLIDAIRYGTAAKNDWAYTNEHLSEYYYEQNAAEYCMFIYAFEMFDNCMHNVYLSSYNTQQDKRLWFTPWDLDASFQRDGWGVHVSYLAYYEYAFQEVSPFRQLYQAHAGPFYVRMAHLWEHHRHHAFHPDSIAKRINDYVDLFERSGAWSREVARWDKQITTPHGVVMELPHDIHQETDWMIDWYGRNFAHMDNQYSYAGVEPTDIRQLNTQTAASPLYDLQGRRVLHPSRCGIYIQNGRKIIYR